MPVLLFFDINKKDLKKFMDELIHYTNKIRPHLNTIEQSFPTLASGPNVAIHHNKFINIFACLYSVYCVTHISTQLAYCANLMVMLSCIAIMKLLHQTIAVET